MNKALRYMFWGYLFIFFRLHVMIDLFMDPIGYYLIFAGCSRLVDAFPRAKKAMIVGLIGMLISVPSVFVNLSDTALPIGWSIYGTLLSVLKLVIAYYLFNVLIDAAKMIGNQALQNRTKTTYKFYISINLFTLALISFSMNVAGDGWIALSLISMIGVLIMDVLFLLLIGAVRRVSPKDHRINYSI